MTNDRFIEVNDGEWIRAASIERVESTDELIFTLGSGARVTSPLSWQDFLDRLQADLGDA